VTLRSRLAQHEAGFTTEDTEFTESLGKPPTARSALLRRFRAALPPRPVSQRQSRRSADCADFADGIEGEGC
jgi:hypothetical protein